jgi:hypothetical protein
VFLLIKVPYFFRLLFLKSSWIAVCLILRLLYTSICKKYYQARLLEAFAENCSGILLFLAEIIDSQSVDQYNMDVIKHCFFFVNCFIVFVV